MIKNLGRPLAFLFLVCILSTCIDPFSPKLKGFKSILIVDAFISNENKSYYVKLSMTTETQNVEPSIVSGAVITLSDDGGGNSLLQETTPGTYKTDSLQFLGQTGKTYVLHIKTSAGSEYESDPCLMYPVQQIGSVYFAKDKEILKNGSETHEGVRIFLDSEGGTENRYFRWVYNECWKFNVPNPKTYDYISESEIVAVDKIKRTCWNSHKSDEIIIQSTESTQTNKIEKKPILFVASDLSDRFLVQYSIEIKQLSLSKNEFEFWDQMKQINESGGNIFDKQPFSVISNIHNITDPAEPVLGYFQVSSVKQKRIYITKSEIYPLNIPIYQYDCDRIEVGPDDYGRPDNPSKVVTFDKIYEWFTSSGVAFVEPVYDIHFRLIKLVFTQPVCSDCALSGSLTKPDFWVDLN
jgi:hypothetical protein